MPARTLKTPSANIALRAAPWLRRRRFCRWRRLMLEARAAARERRILAGSEGGAERQIAGTSFGMRRSPPAMAPESPQSSSLALPARRVGLLDGIDAAWLRALRESFRVLVLSRLVVWGAGVMARGVCGPAGQGGRFDPSRLTAGYGTVGDLLVGPAARWDSVWFLAIAKSGYIGDDRTAFFPLYPTLVRGLGGTLGAGMLLSPGAPL